MWEKQQHQTSSSVRHCWLKPQGHRRETQSVSERHRGSSSSRTVRLSRVWLCSSITVSHCVCVCRCEWEVFKASDLMKDSAKSPCSRLLLSSQSCDIFDFSVFDSSFQCLGPVIRVFSDTRVLCGWAFHLYPPQSYQLITKHSCLSGIETLHLFIPFTLVQPWHSDTRLYRGSLFCWYLFCLVTSHQRWAHYTTMVMNY